MNPRVNLLCVLGALIGLMCVAVPILTLTTHYYRLGQTGSMEYHLYMSASEFVNVHFDPPPIESADFLVALVVFFGGVALAFVTPLGGVGMAVGIVGYYGVLSSKFDAMRSAFSWGHPGVIVTSIHWGAAFYVGILATVVVLVSSILPLGPGYSEMHKPWPFGRRCVKERLLVWGRLRKS